MGGIVFFLATVSSAGGGDLEGLRTTGHLSQKLGIHHKVPLPVKFFSGNMIPKNAFIGTLRIAWEEPL